MSNLNKIWLLGFCCQARVILWQGEKEAAAHKGKVSKVSFQRSRSRSCKFLRLRKKIYQTATDCILDLVIFWYHSTIFNSQQYFSVHWKFWKRLCLLITGLICTHFDFTLYIAFQYSSARLIVVECGNVMECPGGFLTALTLIGDHFGRQPFIHWHSHVCSSNATLLSTNSFF